MCADIYRNCQDGGLEAKQALDRAEQAILELGEQAIPRGFLSLGEAIKGTVFDLEERPDQLLTGLPSGFDDWDALSHGLNAGSLIIIAGRPGMGKCLSRDAEIVEADGSVRTIEEVVRYGSTRLLTLHDNYKLGWASPTAFLDNGVKPVFEITTRLGRRLKATANHPLLTLTGWKPLAEIAVGAAIAVPRLIDAFGSEPVGEHRARLLGYLLGDGGLTGTSPAFTNANTELLADFRDAVARFGGVRTTESRSNTGVPTLRVVSDKSIRREARARFARSLESALAAYGRSARELADAIGVEPSSITAWRRAESLPGPSTAAALALVLEDVPVPTAGRAVASNSVTAWLRELGLMGCGAREKFVPVAVFRALRSEVALFLNRLMATDGWVTVLSSGQVQAGYCSTSEKLARQVQHLLLRFGVISSLRRRRIRYREGYKEAWQLNITDARSITTVLEEIGVHGKESRTLRALEALSKQGRHSNRDLVPAAVWTIIREELGPRSWADLARALGLADGYNLHVGKRAVSRRRLRQIAVALRSERLLELARSDVYWDRIVAVRPVGEEQVYDLTIPATHNFVANDICVHNSSFSTNVAQSLALKLGKSVGIFSLEMSVQEIAMRILASEAEVPLRKRRPSDRDWDRIHRAARRIADARIFIDDSASPTLLEVASKARRLKLEKGLDLLVVDYLQLMQAGGRYENRNLEIGAITRGLKGLAKELSIPVMALSQLSRQPERRGSDHRPQLADLRESGSIEQDADLVAFIYRDEIYNPENEESQGIAELIVAKNRNGQTGTVDLAFFGETTTFRSLSRQPPPPI
jgi:replicative DNA helicase